MKVKIKKLSSKAVLPTKAHPTDAGFDLLATSREIDQNGNIVYGTGLAFEIPEGYVGLLFPRSSICKNDIALSNSVGVIDCHYRGEVMAKFKPTGIADEYFGEKSSFATLYKEQQYAKVYNIGERIAQLIVLPIPNVEMCEVEELSQTDRGANGYGSSGK